MPGMAAPEAFESEPAALQESVAIQGFKGIVGAGRIETAGVAQPRAHCPLIEPDQGCCKVAHCLITSAQSPSRLALKSPPDAPRARARALKTRSSGGSSCWCSRNDSRIARRMRLRSTPVPATLIDTASPSRGAAVPFARAVTPNNALPSRRPLVWIASNSALRRMRRCAGSVYRGRSGGPELKRLQLRP